MVARQQVGPIWTVDQYLVLERYSTVKHEYHGGYVYALAGGSQAHSQIAGNIYALLRTGVRGSGCRALNPAIKIRQSPDDYVYSDAVVTCDPRDDVPGQDWIDYPTLVVEVLSPPPSATTGPARSRDTRTAPPSVSTCSSSTGGARLRCGGATLPGRGTSQPTGRPMMSCWRQGHFILGAVCPAAACEPRRHAWPARHRRSQSTFPWSRGRLLGTMK
jgi:Putative restriction endonuclease